MKKSIKNNALHLNPKLAATAVAACFSAGAALANPTAPTVVNGSASFAQAGNILNITNSPNAIINWGSFSIGVNELTRFIQQSGSSAVLNRVIGQDPSAILGALQSNGRVFLVNPNGIVFGAGAQINVAGLVASTLNLSNDDFLNNRMKFTDGAGAGNVVNQGSITGGSVYLIGKAVTNDGLITSANGEVILAAGNSVELVNPGTPNLRVEIVAADNAAKNLGTITAEAGRIGIYAGLIQQSGTLRADSAVVEGGRIVLKATRNVHLAAASQTSASGTVGGRVDIQAGDTTIVEGRIAAAGSTGAGGTVQVLGNLVGLTGHASIDASGDTQGGTVLIGGDFQGRNPEVRNAFRTYVGPDATIDADAVTGGEGGKVIVWADDVTRFYGNISARGGANSGDGGFVEVSGKRALDFQGFVNTLAPHGTTGTLLLDPDFITISTSGTAPLPPVTGGVGYLFGDAPLSVDIHPNTINASATNVILQANDTIDVSAPISLTNNNVSLTMRAGGFLNVNGSITTKGGALTLVAGDPGGTASEGSLNINAPLDTTGGGAFPLGANIMLAAPISDVGGNSVYINSNITAGNAALGGTVTITGQRLDHVSGTITGSAVNVSMTSAGNGDVTLSGGQINSINVYLEADRDVKLTSGSGIVAVNGNVALFSDSDGNNDGAIVINNGVINARDISLTGGNGYAAGNASNPAGISITNGSTLVRSGGAGSILLQGQGGAGTGGHGVLIGTSTVQNNDGDTLIEGFGGAASGSSGVKFALGGSSSVLGATGKIDVVGSTSAPGGDGVSIAGSAGIFAGGSSGAHDINVTGSGGAGGSGINMSGVSAGIGGDAGRLIFLNALAGGISIDGTVSACQSCGAITLKSTAGVNGSTAALTASGLRLLGSGVFNLNNNGNSLETVAAALSGAASEAHVHNTGNLQVGLVTSFDGVALTTTTGVNAGLGINNVAELQTSGNLTNGNGVVTGRQVMLNAGSIGESGPKFIEVNIGAGGTVSATSTSGGICIEQTIGTLATSSYTLSAPAGQLLALAASGGNLLVNNNLAFGANPLKLMTIGATDIEFNSGASGSVASSNLMLMPEVGRSVLFTTGASPWTINAPTTILNNAGMTLGGGSSASFTNTFDTTGTITVGTGSSLGLSNGAILPTLVTAGNVTGGGFDIDSLTQTNGSIAVSSLIVNQSFSQSAGTITGISGNVELNQASGNLAVKNASAYGRFKAVAASGDLALTGASVSSANGPVELFASGNVLINGSSVNAGSLSPSNLQIAAAGGGVTIQNATVNAANNGQIDIVAATGIDVFSSSAATMVSGGNVTLTSGGNVYLVGGSGAGQSAVVNGSVNTTVNASGDVSLTGGAGANALTKIYGGNDVFMTVGGMIYLDNGTGSGSTAVIESGSVNSIHLSFTNLGSGGFFFNGVEGATGGFIAGGVPAVLGGNLLVTYGGTPPPSGSGGGSDSDGGLDAPIQTLIVASSKSTDSPDAEKDKDVFKEKDGKKKDAPVCK
jgi:filamentous hemagglutinin family protein